MLRPHAHPDRPSRAAGLLAFFAGIAMLVLVFVLAYHLFTQPVAGLNLSLPPKGVPPPAASIGLSLGNFFEKLLLLVMLTVVGSLVASKGIHLCFATGHGHGPAPGHTPETVTTAPRNGHAPLPTATPEATAPSERPAP